jgi:hypothetical protein
MGEREDPARRLDARFADWDARLNRLDAERRQAAEPEVEAEAEVTDEPGGYVLLVPSPSGYELVERDGAVPSTGEKIQLDGREGSYAVTRIVRSPLPDDRRRCAVLEII